MGKESDSYVRNISSYSLGNAKVEKPKKGA